MEKLSYSFLIDNKVSTLTTFKEYFTSMELINLVYSLMCFVLDKSLKDEECTLSSMALILEDLSSQCYDRVLDEEEAYEITHFIVYKILRNDGKPFMFSTIDYSTGENIVFDFHLLQQKTSKKDNNKSTFTLTKEGYRLILGALEVDEKTQIDINQMILELSLKRKNFSQGLYAVENLNNLITAQINVVNNFIYKTRENIFSIEQKDFEDNFLKNIEVLVEQNKKFDELKEIIIVEEERLSKSEGEITKENYESLKQLGRIKELLINISYKASELITCHFHFKDEYKKALEEASFYYNNKRINIKDDLLRPIEKDGSKLGSVYKLFNPLFKASITKKFNINYMLNEQRLYFKDEQEDEIVIDLIENEDYDLILKQKNRQQYKEIISALLAFLVDNRESDLLTMMNSYNNKSILEYTKLVPTIRKFSEVLIELLRIGTIDIEEMIKDQNDAYDNEEIEFDLRALLVDEMQDKYRFVSIKCIHFNKCNDGAHLTITEKSEKELPEDFVTVENLNCPNIIMKLE